MAATFGLVKVCKMNGFLTTLAPRLALRKRSYGIMLTGERRLWERDKGNILSYTQQIRTLFSEVHIRTVKEDELDILTEWAKEENWPVCKHATRAGYTYDPQGFLVAVNNDNQPLGFIAVVNHSDYMSFAGYFIVREDIRENGIGKRIYHALERHIGERNVAFNSVLDKTEIYERWLNPNKVFEIDGFVGTPSVPDLSITNVNIAISALSDDLFTSVVRYDAEIHTIKRQLFLSKWLSADVSRTFVAIADEKVVGYGCLYQTQKKTYNIGPLFADNFEIATLLLNELMLKLEPGSSISFDVPKTQRQFEVLVKARGFRRYTGYLRMSKRQHPDVQLHKVYCLTDNTVSLI